LLPDPVPGVPPAPPSLEALGMRGVIVTGVVVAVAELGAGGMSVGSPGPAVGGV
jgi:hypothetical protein